MNLLSSSLFCGFLIVLFGFVRNEPWNDIYEECNTNTSNFRKKCVGLFDSDCLKRKSCNYVGVIYENDTSVAVGILNKEQSKPWHKLNIFTMSAPYIKSGNDYRAKCKEHDDWNAHKIIIFREKELSDWQSNGTFWIYYLKVNWTENCEEGRKLPLKNQSVILFDELLTGLGGTYSGEYLFSMPEFRDSKSYSTFDNFVYINFNSTVSHFHGFSWIIFLLAVSLTLSDLI